MSTVLLRAGRGWWEIFLELSSNLAGWTSMSTVSGAEIKATWTQVDRNRNTDLLIFLSSEFDVKSECWCQCGCSKFILLWLFLLFSFCGQLQKINSLSAVSAGHWFSISGWTWVLGMCENYFPPDTYFTVILPHISSQIFKMQKTHSNLSRQCADSNFQRWAKQIMSMNKRSRQQTFTEDPHLSWEGDS